MKWLMSVCVIVKGCLNILVFFITSYSYHINQKPNKLQTAVVYKCNASES